uniref:Uncharacterized protein n=1 Tax=Setaria italica TaxID=4555 RepID=K3YWR1_SETIT
MGASCHRTDRSMVVSYRRRTHECPNQPITKRQQFIGFISHVPPERPVQACRDASNSDEATTLPSHTGKAGGLEGEEQLCQNNMDKENQRVEDENHPDIGFGGSNASAWHGRISSLVSQFDLETE